MPASSEEVRVDRPGADVCLVVETVADHRAQVDPFFLAEFPHTLRFWSEDMQNSLVFCQLTW